MEFCDGVRCVYLENERIEKSCKKDKKDKKIIDEMKH
jgi:hypothetical protein